MAMTSLLAVLTALLYISSLHSFYLHHSRYDNHHRKVIAIASNPKNSLQTELKTTDSRNKQAVNTTAILPSGFGKKLVEKILLVISDKQSPPIVTVTRLQSILKDEDNNLHHVHIVTLLQRCAKMNVILTPVFSLKYFNEILTRRVVTWLPVEIAHSLYALKMYKPVSSGVGKYLDIIISQLQKCDLIFSNQEICNSFYGLQHFYNSNVENRQMDSSSRAIGLKVDAILQLLIEKLKLSQTELSGQDLANILYGLRKMNNNDPNNVINELFDLLAAKISYSSSCYLNHQGIGLSLNGLQRMSSDNPGTLVILSALIPLLEESSDALNDKCIGMAVMGLRNMKNDNPQVQQLVSILTSKIKKSTTPLKHSSFSSAMYGLRSLSDSDPIVAKLLEALCSKLPDDKDEHMTPATVAHCLAGLQSMGGNQAITRDLLTYFNSKLVVNEDNVYKIAWLSRSFQGLQGVLPTIDSNPDVKALVNKLTAGLESLQMTNEAVSMDDVGYLLYSFHNCTNESDDVNRVLATVTRLLRPESKPRSLGLASPKAMSMCMYGLKCMSSSNEVVCKLLGALRPRVSALDAQSVGNILFGMQRLSSTAPQVCAFIDTITPKIAQVNAKLSGQEIANSFYGLQNFDSVSVEVNKLLKVLVVKLEESKGEVFTSQGIGNAISGFQSMSLSDDVETISKALGLFADIIEASSLPMSARDISNAMFGLQEKIRNTTDIFTSRDIGYCLSGLSLMQHTVYDEVNEFIDELTIQTSRSELKGEPNLSFFLFDRGIKVKKL